MAQLITPLRRDQVFFWLLILFITLSVVELALTVIGLRLGGLELNPLARLVFARSPLLAALLKIGGTLLMAANMAIAFPVAPKWARREAFFFCVIVGIAVLFDSWSLMHITAQQVIS
jgi:uncharacterized protein DUF5658